MFASSVVRELIRHPHLLVEAVRAFVAFTPRDWWRHAPYLPVPRRIYLQWRIQTAYGATDADIQSADLIDYLKWRRNQR